MVVLALGWWLARLLKVEREAGQLIPVGTAICGGSAIAAVAPMPRAKEHEISVPLATVRPTPRVDPPSRWLQRGESRCAWVTSGRFNQEIGSSTRVSEPTVHIP